MSKSPWWSTTLLLREYNLKVISHTSYFTHSSLDLTLLSFFPLCRIPLLGLVIALWLILCHYTRKQGGEEEAWPPRANNSASVYIIPMHEEEDEESDSCDPNSQTSYNVPPVYGSGNISPPPYRVKSSKSCSSKCINGVFCSNILYNKYSCTICKSSNQPSPVLHSVNHRLTQSLLHHTSTLNFLHSRPVSPLSPPPAL